MASVKWSGLVSEVKGVMNGTIFSVGYGGQQMRNRISGGGRKTSAWSVSKVRMARVSGTWRSLTSAQQTAWIAAGPSYPYTDKFGNSQIPSGFQLYCTLNVNLLVAGQSMITAPVAPAAPESIGSPTVTQPSSTNLQMSFTPSGANRTQICVYLSQPLSKGVTIQPRTMRLVSVIASSTASPYSLTSDYNRIFTSIPTTGRVFYSIEQINKTTGQRQVPVTGFVDLA